jgi:hypothetical protein
MKNADRMIPKFENEKHEAAGWDRNREHVEHLLQAMQDGTAQRGTA